MNQRVLLQSLKHWLRPDKNKQNKMSKEQKELETLQTEVEKVEVNVKEEKTLVELMDEEADYIQSQFDKLDQKDYKQVQDFINMLDSCRFVEREGLFRQTEEGYGEKKTFKLTLNIVTHYRFKNKYRNYRITGYTKPIDLDYTMNLKLDELITIINNLHRYKKDNISIVKKDAFLEFLDWLNKMDYREGAGTRTDITQRVDGLSEVKITLNKKIKHYRVSIITDAIYSSYYKKWN
jgi:hypothetical protein